MTMMFIVCFFCSFIILIYYRIKSKELLFSKSLLERQINDLKLNFDIYKKVTNIEIEKLQSTVEKNIRSSKKWEDECLILQKSIKDYEVYVKNIKKNYSIPDDTIDAVKYAMVRSHPDNGGNPEDFIKFRKVYKKIYELRG